MIKITVDISQKDFEKAMVPEMDKPIDHLTKELLKLRTGRASTAMVEDIKADCYGSEMRIKELAVLSAPEARLIVIQPWDKSVINEIEKALSLSDLGVTPINDGELIRIQLPQVSQSRREELQKVLNKKLEECRTSIRCVRKDFQNAVRSAEKSKAVSEDFSKRLLDSVQKTTDSFIAKAEDIANRKEKELSSI